MNPNDKKDPLDIFNLDIDRFFDDFDKEINYQRKNDIEVLDIDFNDEDIEILNIDDDKFHNIEVLDIQDINLDDNIEVLDIEGDVSNQDVEILDFGDDTKIINNNDEWFIYEDVKENSSNTLVYKPSVRKRKKYTKIILLIILLIMVLGIIFSVYKIVKWQLDNNSTNKQIIKVQQETIIEEQEDNENTVIVENNDVTDNDDKQSIDETNDYYRFIKMPLINVDLTNLQNQNNDTIGWLQVNGTNINYPVVQTSNNEYYLTHDFTKKYNDGGWIFADYRNNLVNDKNLIIYGHARLNLTMFGTLKNVIKASWYTNNDNHLVRLSTINSNMSYQVFSTYVIEAEDYYIKTDFNSNEDYLKFLNEIKSRSVYNYGVNLDENDRILTLSTCYTDNKRVVLHAKLIKYENR